MNSAMSANFTCGTASGYSMSACQSHDPGGGGGASGDGGSLSPASSTHEAGGGTGSGGFRHVQPRGSRHPSDPGGTFAPSPHTDSAEAKVTLAAVAGAPGSLPPRSSPMPGGVAGRYSSAAAATTAAMLLSPVPSMSPPPTAVTAGSVESTKPVAVDTLSWTIAREPASAATAAAAMELSANAPVTGPSGFLSPPHMLSGPRGIGGINMEEAEAAAARAQELKARSMEAKARSEAAEAAAAAAAAAAEVVKEAATAVVMPLPATREEATTDGRVGRRENAFLDTYFAFFGRFAR